MGGKNAIVILDDADIDLAVTTIINAAFFSTGQKCTAASRIIVTEGIYSAFLNAFSNAAATLKWPRARSDDASRPARERRAAYKNPVLSENSATRMLRSWVANSQILSSRDITFLPLFLLRRHPKCVSIKKKFWARMLCH